MQHVGDEGLALLDWATGVTRDYVQSIADSYTGVSKDALRAAADGLAEIGPATNAETTGDELQAVRRQLEASTRSLRGVSRNASANALVAIETCWRLSVASSVPSGGRARGLSVELARSVGLGEGVIKLIEDGEDPRVATAAEAAAAAADDGED